MLDRITGLMRQGSSRTRTGGGGLPGKAASFVSGFLSGGEQSKRGRRARGGRRRR
jgi:hypothetical protein